MMNTNILLPFNVCFASALHRPYLSAFPGALVLAVPVGAVGGLARVGAGARYDVGQRGHTAPALAAASLSRTSCFASSR